MIIQITRPNYILHVQTLVMKRKRLIHFQLRNILPFFVFLRKDCQNLNFISQ